MPWLVYSLTESALLLGLVGFAGQIPTFLLSPFAGVLTDRLNRYHILIATQVLAMIQAVILTILFFLGNIQVWHIISLNVMLGCISAFDVPARWSHQKNRDQIFSPAHSFPAPTVPSVLSVRRYIILKSQALQMPCMLFFL
ncbi:MAG: MFS transporter [Atribacterota bacterium]|nr:MFS transporter [Atribacterota bacterium]